MKKPSTVLISGASVAGLSLVYWLSRSGFAVTVVEQAPALPTGGHGVDFRGAQLKVLDRMGIREAVQERATGLGEQVIVDRAGEPLVRLPPAMFGGEVEISRSDLTRVIHERIGDDVEFRFGDRVTGIAQDDSGVEATFARSEPRRFDVVVGADGLHSGVRTATFGPTASFAVFLGYYQASFTMPNDLGLERIGVIYNEPARAATVISGADASHAAVDLVFSSTELDYDWRDRETIAALVERRYDGAGWQVPQLLTAMRQAADLQLLPFTQIHLDRWSSGRVVLLGDAAWCAGPGGSGTGLAMLGAFILAAELKANGGDHRRAFERYEAALRKGATAGQKQAKGSGPFLAPASASRIRSRDRTMRFLSSRMMMPLFTRMTEASANAVTLADYPPERP